MSQDYPPWKTKKRKKPIKLPSRMTDLHYSAAKYPWLNKFSVNKTKVRWISIATIRRSIWRKQVAMKESILNKIRRTILSSQIISFAWKLCQRLESMLWVLKALCSNQTILLRKGGNSRLLTHKRLERQFLAKIWTGSLEVRLQQLKRQTRNFRA